MGTALHDARFPGLALESRPGLLQDEAETFRVTDDAQQAQLHTLARFPRENPNPVFRISKTGTIDYANDAGVPLLETIASGDYRDALARVRQTGEAEQIEILVDGRVFVLDVTPVADAEYLYLYGKDVTGQRDAEKKTRAWAKFPLENPSPVMRVGRSGVIEFANEATHDLLRRMSERYELRVPTDWLPVLHAAQESGKPGEIEVRVDDRWFRLTMTPLRDADYAYIYGTDVTERTRAEQDVIAARDAAETANWTKTTFLANMSHELRTPLNSILGYCQLLHEEADEAGDEAYLPDLDKIQSASQHLLGLISQVLDMSNIETGKMKVESETFDLAPVLDALNATSAPRAADNGNELELHVDSDVGRMHADRAKFRRILSNLVDNAIKFTTDGKIRLTAARERGDDGRDWLRFEVRDTGIGMNEAQLESLFEAFTQADGSATREFGGVGLGLAIARSFCEMMKGTINVESKEHEGTTFTVSLPAGLEKETENRKA